jgi:hypothetical protein
MLLEALDPSHSPQMVVKGPEFQTRLRGFTKAYNTALDSQIVLFRNNPDVQYHLVQN